MPSLFHPFNVTSLANGDLKVTLTINLIHGLTLCFIGIYAKEKRNDNRRDTPAKP